MTIKKDLNRGVGIIAKALAGLPGVTFSMDLNASYFSGQPDRVHSEVTLWFYNTFPMKVHGGLDFKLLAIHARDSAEHALLTLKKKKRCPREYHTYLVSEADREKHAAECLRGGNSARKK